MFGREPRLPIDLVLDNPESRVPKNPTDYLKQWEKSMSEADKIAAINKSNDLILNLTPENMTQHSRTE